LTDLPSVETTSKKLKYANMWKQNKGNTIVPGLLERSGVQGYQPYRMCIPLCPSLWLLFRKLLCLWR